MYFHRIIKYLFLSFSLLLTSNFVFSQMYGPFGSVDYSAATNYGEDTIFVFYESNPDKIIAAEHSTEDTSDFKWSRFNKNTEEFDSLFTHEDSLTSKIEMDSLYSKGMLKDTVEGLRVEITNDEDSIEQYTSWVVMDTFPEFGEIREEKNNCESLWMAVDAFNLVDYTYYNLSDSSFNELTLDNERTVEWEASENVNIYDPETLYDYGDKFIGKIGQVTAFSDKIPYEDSDYYLEVTNSFGNTKSDTIEDVTAKAVKSDFSTKKVLEDGTEEDYKQSDINEALLKAKFENKSKNADSHHWISYRYSDSLLSANDDEYVLDTLWENGQETPSDDSLPEYRPGKYAVKLSTENIYGCADDKGLYYLEVDSSMIDTSMIPNVFTPNEDGANDKFVLPKKSNISNPGSPRGIISMKRVEVTILNRSGELVYKYEGNPDDWEGWKGKVKNSNRDAAEGVYLYVIIGKGYDGVNHESKKYTGILYLYR
ncbi:MAG: gliding motility-associated C-terminal domain-containing protein [Bacteroidota bacterium]